MIQSPRILIALDFDNLQNCLRLVDALDPKACRLKVGKEMFTAHGPSFIETLMAKGFDVFLDLKFHDIPNTVAKAVKAASDMGVWMVNIHASGGVRMLDAAVDALANVRRAPILIAVTVLTSMTNDELHQLGIHKTTAEYAQNLASLSYQAGIDGVVCSAHEVANIKADTHSDFLCVTPGIRPASSDADDQRRIMTPAKALLEGSDYLVIGRPITQADDPSLALSNIIRDIQTNGLTA